MTWARSAGTTVCRVPTLEEVGSAKLLAPDALYLYDSQPFVCSNVF